MKNKDNGGLDESIQSLEKLEREMKKTLKVFLNEMPNMQTTLHEAKNFRKS